MDWSECAKWDTQPKEGGHSTMDTSVNMETAPLLGGSLSQSSTLSSISESDGLDINHVWKKKQAVFKYEPLKPEEEMKGEFYNRNIHIPNEVKGRVCHTYIRLLDVFEDSTINPHMSNLIKLCCMHPYKVSEYFCVKCDQFFCAICVHNNITDCITKSVNKTQVKTPQHGQLQQVKFMPHVELNNGIHFPDSDIQTTLPGIRKATELASDLKLASDIELDTYIHDNMVNVQIENKYDEEIEESGDLVKIPQHGKLRQVKFIDHVELKNGIHFPDNDIPTTFPGIRKTTELASDLELGSDLELDIYRHDNMVNVKIEDKEEKEIYVPLLESRDPVKEKGKTAKCCIVPEITTIEGQRHVYTTLGFTNTPELKWHKDGLQDGVDVAFTPKGHIVVCDWGDCNVLLYNNEGKVVSTTKEKGVRFELRGKPWGVTHDWRESAIIVTDGKGCLTFLSDEDLTVIRRVKLSGKVRAARGIGVLSDGRLVVSTCGDVHVVGIYDRQGRRQKYIAQYGEKNLHAVSQPWYIAVLPDDTIAVGMWWGRNHVVYLSADLQCQQVVEVNCPQGLSVSPQGNVLVAGKYPQCIYCLCEVEPAEVKGFSKKEIKECGDYISVAMKDNLLAIVFQRALRLFHWP